MKSIFKFTNQEILMRARADLRLGIPIVLSGKKIDTIYKVPKREVRVALVGMQSFYKKIDPTNSFNPGIGKMSRLRNYQ